MLGNATRKEWFTLLEERVIFFKALLEEGWDDDYRG